MASFTRLRTTLRTIIVEEMMMVDLRSDQPTKMTPKSILRAYKADLQWSHKIPALQILSDSAKVKGHDSIMCHRAIMGKNNKLKMWPQRPPECQKKKKMIRTFTVFDTEFFYSGMILYIKIMARWGTKYLQFSTELFKKIKSNTTFNGDVCRKKSDARSELSLIMLVRWADGLVGACV